MSINFDHTKSGTITLLSEESQGFSCFIFPNTENNNPLEIMVDGHSNYSYISGLSGLGTTDVFNYTNDIDTNCSYAFSVDSTSTTEVYGSIFFGHDGKSKYNYCDGTNYEVRIDNHLIHSAGYIYNRGDAQSTILLSRANSDSDSISCLLFATTDADIMLYSNIDVIGKGTNSNNCFVAFNIKGAFLKGTTSAICTGTFIYTDIVSCNLNTGFAKNVSVENGNFCITVENAAGLMWLTRACFLEIPSISGEAGPATHGIYWTNTNDDNWFNLYNWYSDVYETNASSYPTIATNAIMSGNSAAVTDIDCQLWIQPNSIDTTLITDNYGICLGSNYSGIFSGHIYGCAHLYGNIIFQ
jgi:hypothetical protein